MGFDVLPTGIATGVAGSLCAAQVVQAVAAGGRFVLPAGTYIVYAVGADVRFQVQDASAVWQNVTALAAGGIFASDGTNMAMGNAGGASENFTYIKVG